MLSSAMAWDASSERCRNESPIPTDAPRVPVLRSWAKASMGDGGSVRRGPAVSGECGPMRASAADWVWSVQAVRRGSSGVAAGGAKDG